VVVLTLMAALLLLLFSVLKGDFKTLMVPSTIFSAMVALAALSLVLSGRTRTATFVGIYVCVCVCLCVC
jgi:hypothetical protein